MCLPWSRAARTFADVEPDRLRGGLELGTVERGRDPNSLSCIAQNLASPPCARASSATIAAGIACGWKLSGWCFQAMRTLPGNASWTAWRLGSTRLQNGHWKSETTTIVTSASAGPRRGVSSTGTL